VVAPGVFPAGALEQIADHALVGRRRQSRLPVKESDRRRPRVQGLGGRAAVAQRPQEGRDEGRVRPKGFQTEGVGVDGELPPAGLVGSARVLGGGAGDELARGGDGAGDMRGGGGRNVDHAGSHSSGGRASPVVVIKPLNFCYQLSAQLLPNSTLSREAPSFAAHDAIVETPMLPPLSVLLLHQA
jgi:hypothetical protein